jgi:hypothetical protein
MRFRLGLIIGFAIGYFFGAKAGRERYEQIVAAFRTVTETETAQRTSDQVRSTVAEGMQAASQAIRDRLAES